jgi:hypothetical protein
LTSFSFFLPFFLKKKKKKEEKKMSVNKNTTWKKENTWTLYNGDGKELLNHSPEEMMKMLNGISLSVLAQQGYTMIDNNNGGVLLKPSISPERQQQQLEKEDKQPNNDDGNEYDNE